VSEAIGRARQAVCDRASEILKCRYRRCRTPPVRHDARYGGLFIALAVKSVWDSERAAVSAWADVGFSERPGELTIRLARPNIMRVPSASATLPDFGLKLKPLTWRIVRASLGQKVYGAEFFFTTLRRYEQAQICGRTAALGSSSARQAKALALELFPPHNLRASRQVRSWSGTRRFSVQQAVCDGMGISRRPVVALELLRQVTAGTLSLIGRHRNATGKDATAIGIARQKKRRQCNPKQ
jgi:hypothetical protein